VTHAHGVLRCVALCCVEQVWWHDWLPFLSHFRIPGDSIYLHEPRPTEEYKVLAASGAKYMGMRDAGISFRPPSNGSLPAGYVESVIEQLAPTMASLSDLGLLEKAYLFRGTFRTLTLPLVLVH
jgi:hypothetical protein